MPESRTTPPTEEAATTSSIEQEVRRHLRWNITVNMLDGASFWIGMAFYSFSTVLALFVSKLTPSPFALGFLATVANSGWLLPQLFTAHWTQRTPVKKDLPVKVGLFTERLPILLLALIAWGVAGRNPTLALWLTLIVATWAAFGAGVIAIGWQSMITKVIPQEIRGRFFGVTNALGMGGGAVAALMVAYILDRYPFPSNFAFAFTLGALFTFLSWLFLALTREPPDLASTRAESAASFWAEVPCILRQDRNFRHYLLARFWGAWGTMGTGFLAVYAVQRWALSDGQVGFFNGIATGVQLAAQLALGVLADRYGHKPVLEIGTLANAVGFLIAWLTPTPLLVYATFAGLGIAMGSYLVSGMMIVPEFAPAERLALYFGLASTIPGIVSMIVPLLGATLARTLGYPPLFLLTGLGSLVSLVILRAWVIDPRHWAASAAA